MRERALRRRCRQLLTDLDIRPPLDVTELCRKVGEQRGRPIRLIAHPIPVPGPFGVWIADEDADYVIYQEKTTKSHQGHIILHELGHMIAGHRPGADDELLMAELLAPAEPEPAELSERFPDLDPEAVRRALRRSSYDNDQEREAETVATIILEWASVLDRVAPRTSGDPMETALADRLGWL
ncbi:CUE domain-containing protein [Amycolatopsis suaedae]|uniref:ImmA/IrrE family metallo-endopeptidase n=1 Tax=Amycolatopsis suaedae TaxID=2510978 RepID=A0A4Q7J1A3_9PSEU|nr:CUE domain-containing protein [Amycolatopsis suaedae]RZQ60607.1 hypothetical protein EWH70_28490 [Amycolatopsis suaedae]